jgi:hypothetical protein
MSVTINPTSESIRRLEAIRNETRYWSLGAFVAILVLLAVSVVVVIGDVRDLFQPGDVQAAFVSDLESDLGRDVIPSVQALATSALAQSQPQIQAQFANLGNRVPDVSSAFIDQFQTLQSDLSSSGGQIISSTYGKTLDAEEPTLQKLVPTATPDSVDSLVGKLSAEGNVQVANDSQKLFGPQVAAFTGIVSDLNTIKSTEPVEADQQKANFEMALTAISAFNSDLSNQASNVTAASSVKEKS